jgi:NDP-sugar pyrophosphorylase family protein
MTELIGIGLAAGQGIRCRPLTLKSRGYIRSKAAVHFLGHRVLDWLLLMMQAQGVAEIFLITQGKENRCQVKSIAGYGEHLGLQVRYSPICFDHDNAGSADALLANLDYFDVRQTAFVFPTDSVLEVNLSAMLAAHQRTGAVVTIASALQPPERIAHQYGLMDCTADHRVRGFVEKPSLSEIVRRCGLHDGASAAPVLLDTNAGFYLIDSLALRGIAQHPDILAMRGAYFDIGGNLLPWLVEHGYPVYTFPVQRMGDLGNIPSYLETLVDVLSGHFPAMMPFLGQDASIQEGLFIDPTSLAMTDPLSGLTLQAKIAQQLVTVRPPLRIGKYVRVYPHATLSACNIDDECEIHEHASIVRASIGDGSIIGPYCDITDTVTGMMVALLSEHEAPITLSRFAALGDSVVVGSGVTMRDHVTVYPQLAIPAHSLLTGNRQIDSAEAVRAVHLSAV